MIRHGRTYTGEKPYKCEWCDYPSANYFTIIRHGRTHTSGN